MEALYNGTVVAEGVDLVPKIIQRPLDIFSRMLKSDEFDVAEMSLTHCFVLRAKSTARFVTLPIFPSRMFRHGFIFVNRKSGIRTPAELAGRRIGVQGYQMTAAVWIRGHLRSDYEVNLDGVEWFEGGVNMPGVAGGDATSFRPLQPLKIRSIGMDDTLSAMLARGDIDALFGADVPDSLGSGDVVRLFPDFHAVERAYYQRTAIFPIMHALVDASGTLSSAPVARWRAAAGLQCGESCGPSRRKIHGLASLHASVAVGSFDRTRRGFRPRPLALWA